MRTRLSCLSSPPAANCSLSAGFHPLPAASCQLPVDSSAHCQLPAASCPLGEVHEPKWYVLWTRSQCEQVVYEQLADRGFRPFLPTLGVWVRRKGNRRRVTVPMFPGYLFLNHSMDKASYIEITKARGLVKMLGDAWDALAEVPDGEMGAIQRIHQAEVPAVAHPYLQAGERVRIREGLLEGVEGILVRIRPEKGLVVVSVNILRRSVAVEVDCAAIEPA